MATLVTGGSGFVGLNVVQQLLERGDTVVSLALTPPPPAAAALFGTLPGTLHTATGDVRDAAVLEALFAAQPIRRVIHAAVITAGPEREAADPHSILAVNLQGTLNVLEAARHHGVQRFVYPSSGSVYGDSAFAHPVLVEDEALPQPVTLYGITKYASERMALRYRSLHGLDVVAARLGIVYGRWEYATGQRDTLSALYHLTELARAGESAVLPNAGRRDWIYAPDVAEGLLALLDATHLRHTLYHVAPGTEFSAEEWCERLQGRYPDFRFRIAGNVADANVNLHRATQRAPLSPERLAADTGFRAHFGLEDAFADYLDWLEFHPL